MGVGGGSGSSSSGGIGDDGAAVEPGADAAAPVDAGGGDDAAFVDPYGGASGCSTGGVQLGAHTCSILMPLSGGLSGTLSFSESYGCGWANGAAPLKAPLNFGVDPHGPPPWNGTVVRFDPTGEIVPGQTGTLTNVVVSLWAMNDAGSVTWITPATCTLQITSNACVASPSVPDLYVISGTGSCADPAQAAGHTPVTIGSFFFAAEYTGPSTDQ